MLPQQIPIYFVDAFTTNGNSPYTGNPAAVCLLEYDDEIPDDIKQKIASEVNLSETAFVSYGWTKSEKLETTTEANGSLLHRRTLRWFTPTNEVRLCGHATVASTKALLEAQFSDLKSDPKVKEIKVSFESKFRGKLGATLDKGTGRVTLNFPANPTEKLDKSKHSSWIDEMIRTTMGKEVSPEKVVDVQYSPLTKILLLRLQNDKSLSAPDLLKSVSPDFKRLMEIDMGNFIQDIIITVKGEAEVEGPVSEKPHFYSRFFAPWDGIDEDPVTGLAHTVLTPYWTQELKKSMKGEAPVVGMTLLGRQHSKRGVNVYCTLIGDRVNLAGEARVVINGNLSP